jgi:hypothetical protein
VARTQSDVTELLDAIRAGGGLDVIRSGVELVLQALIDTEATEEIGAAPARADRDAHEPAQRHKVAVVVDQGRPKSSNPTPRNWGRFKPSTKRGEAHGGPISGGEAATGLLRLEPPRVS